MSVLCTMAAFLFTLTFTSCGDDDDDDDSDASAYEEETEGSINGYDYVDLGLSVKWATCNVGADSPEEYGDYYAWGETETKSSYNEGNSETYDENIDDISGTDRDVAHVKWGGTWRMPTKDDFEELIDNCDYKWTTLNGVWGGRLTSNKNGNSIFLPATGFYEGKTLEDTGEYGYYWSSTPFTTEEARDLGFDSEGLEWSSSYRSDGQSVRPVSE